MSDYAVSQVYPSDKRSLAGVDALLHREGITRDGNLDYICAMRDENDEIIATGSCFGCTLRCFAVSWEHQGEGLLNEIISHLMEVQMARGNLHLFLYTKVNSARFFGDLGFYEIARVLPKGTGYVTDLGMTGPRDSVLGIRPELSIAKFRGDLPERYRWAEGPTKMEAVLFTIDSTTGSCLKAERVDEWD